MPDNVRESRIGAGAATPVQAVVGELVELPAMSLADSMNAASVGDGSRGPHARAIRQRAAG